MLKHDSMEAKKIKKIADIKRKQLTAMLAKPLFPRGFSGKYPLQTETGTLAMKNDGKSMQEERAIDVMKTAMETNVKRKRKPIFKKRPVFNRNQEEKTAVVKTIEKRQKNKKRSKK